MGVDFPSRDELLAHQVANGDTSISTIGKKVGKAIGVEEFHYNDIEGLEPGDRPATVEPVLRLHQRGLLEARGSRRTSRRRRR